MGKKKDFVSLSDISREEIDSLLAFSKRMQNHTNLGLCNGKILASCFFEPSTRTRLSFECAILRLGGAYIGFSDSGTTSVKKGETLADTIRVIGAYADLIVIRSPEIGSGQIAANATDKPVINGGDGAGEHPSQTLVDLFTILQTQNRIDGLTIGIAGDLKYGRAAHSLAQGLSHYNVKVKLISPPSLALPVEFANLLKDHSVHHEFESSIEDLDVLYMTRIQKERFRLGEPFPTYKLHKEHLKRAKKNLKILHPLPRLEELDISLDTSPHAHYFEQAGNAIPVRMALIAKLLGKI